MSAWAANGGASSASGGPSISAGWFAASNSKARLRLQGSLRLGHEQLQVRSERSARAW